MAQDMPTAADTATHNNMVIQDNPAMDQDMVTTADMAINMEIAIKVDTATNTIEMIMLMIMFIGAYFRLTLIVIVNYFRKKISKEINRSTFEKQRMVI